MQDKYEQIKDKIEYLSLALKTSVNVTWRFTIDHKYDEYPSTREHFSVYASGYENIQLACLSHLYLLDNRDFVKEQGE